MDKVKVWKERCKGCGYCIAACSQNAIAFSDIINPKGYNTVIVEHKLCIGCGACYRVCPDYVFTVNKEGGMSNG